VDADEAASVALRFCDDEYPGATTIVLGGSSSTGRRTPTSDIDLLVIAPPTAFRDGAGDDHGEARVVHRDGERFDVFAYTVAGFRDWAERDFASLRPVLPFLLTEGTPLRTGDEFAPLRNRAAERLAAGPRVTAHQVELRRYAITDLIDDLGDATDPLAVAAIRADLLRGLGELATLTAGGWLGSGKWLARRLRAADPAAADRLEAFVREGDPARAAAAAARMLDTLGGRVDTDFAR
jgi:predicted nucleotidyltransferase